MNLQKILLVTAVILSIDSGCKKAYDYINSTPIGTCDACKIVQFTTYSTLGAKVIFNVNYDKKGNIISIVADRYHAWLNYYIRYDKRNRITDILQNYYGATGAIAWNTFTYLPRRILDTAYFYGDALLTDPHPPYDINESNILPDYLETDGFGRVSNAEDFPVLLYTNHLERTDYKYDKRGNLIRQGSLTDNKINPNRTNPLWQFLNLDYSVNNLIDDPANDPDNPFSISPIITSYNSYGLPTHYKSSRSDSEHFLFGLSFFELDITYDCNLSKIK